MRAGAIFGQRLLAVAGDDFQLDAGLRQRLLHAFGNAGYRLGVAHIHGHGEAVLQAGLGEKLLRLGDVQLVGVLVKRAELALRQEGLVNFADALDDRRADGIVVDQIFEGFDDFGLLQVLVLLVEAEIIDGALRRGGDGKAFLLGNGFHVARLEVAGHIDIAVLKRQALARAFLHVAIDHTLQLRLLAVIIRVGLEDDGFVGLPAEDLVRAGTGITGLQELVAEIRVVFVVGARRDRLGLFRHEFLVDHRSDGCGQHVQHEARRIGLVDRQNECVRIRSLRLFGDVVTAETELRQQECRRLVELHGAFEGESHIIGRDRIARREFQAGFQLERIGETIVGGRPAFGQIADNLGRVVKIDGNQLAVGVAGDFGGGKFESLARIERDDVVDGETFDQRIGRRCGKSMGRGQHHQRQSGAGAQNTHGFVERFDHRISPFVISLIWFASALLRPPRARPETKHAASFPGIF